MKQRPSFPHRPRRRGASAGSGPVSSFGLQRFLKALSGRCWRGFFNLKRKIITMTAGMRAAAAKAPVFKPAQHLTLPSKGALYLSPQGRACRFMRMVQANDGAAAEAEFMYESDAGRTGPREGFTLAARNFWLLKQVG